MSLATKVRMKPSSPDDHAADVPARATFQVASTGKRPRGEHRRGFKLAEAP